MLYLHYFSLTFFPLFFFNGRLRRKRLRACACVCVRMLGWLRYEVENFVNEDLLDKGYEVLRVCVCGCVCACMCGRGALLWLAFSLASRFFWVSSLRNLLSARVWEAGAHAKRSVNSESFL